MTLANMTEAISSSVAVNALCWCAGRSTRITRLRNPLAGLEPDADDAMKLRFYTRVRADWAIGRPTLVAQFWR